LAVVGSESAQKVIADASAVTVPEGGAATFGVKLAQAPAATVTVAVATVYGDSSITVQSGASLTFTTNNWDQWQTVTLAAAKDEDSISGGARFEIMGAGLVNATVWAYEVEEKQVLCIVAPDLRRNLSKLGKRVNWQGARKGVAGDVRGRRKGQIRTRCRWQCCRSRAGCSGETSYIRPCQIRNAPRTA
jgi:hypothetical protein